MPCIHTAVVMQGAAPSQAALQGSSQGQHPAAPSRLAHASGPANVATASTPSVPVQPASIFTIDPAVSMVTEPAASMVTEPAPMPNVEPAPVVDSEPALPGADLTGHGAAEPAYMPNVEAAPVVDSEAAPPGTDLAGHGAAEPACLVVGAAAEDEARETTGLTPMVKAPVRQGRPLCTETWF